MGWKKDFKKQFKERNKSIFDFSDGESSIIFWERSNGTPNSLALENILEISRNYKYELQDKIENSFYPEELKKFNHVFNELGTSEYFDYYLSISDFDNISNQVKNQYGEYASEVIKLALFKWNYFTNVKFFDVYNLTFSGQKDFNESLMFKVFESMKLTNLEAIEKIIVRTFELLDTVNRLEPYRHYLLVEEIIDLGEEFTWHWSKMLDQVVDVAVESMYEKTEADMGSSTYDYYDNESFDDFFEKTKTMALNDELDEAFNYFGISYSVTDQEFKKIYRTLAKQYHPDINKDPSAAVEMKKINMYKSVIEEYLNGYGI